ncbi:DUF4249 domain-containing protein [Tenacibaculum sp.]|uniref:DUF4249 domain-containing protein n=1 Tax=Tenacibaculum sp. TaxID=1906242 RepID=UPI003D13262E
MNFRIKAYIYISVLLTFFSCIEPIDIKEINYENYLVVEANLTDQLKKHTIKLSRSFMLNDSIPKYESNANVKIIDSNENTYTFSEVEEGVYESDDIFKAELNNTYTLHINTSDGNEYSSTPEKISGINEIDDITIGKSITPENIEGLKINVISNTEDVNSLYYRYEFNETYKIVAPYWTQFELVPVSREYPFSVTFEVKDYLAKECYQTQKSNTIIQTETTGLDKNNVNFTIRFLEKNDFIISHRYSILVKQYVQSANAYRYFKTLKKLSVSQGAFTQNQPGFIPGNITNNKTSDDKVLGFFEVTSYSEKRFFFNYLDMYPDGSIDYISNCDFIKPKMVSGFMPPFNSPLIAIIDRGEYLYYKINVEPTAIEGPYILVPKICGDCRILGSNVKPSFWID